MSGPPTPALNVKVTSPQDPEVFDILIIGGGPTGLFAAFYAGLRGMRTKLIDSLPELGGQLATIYPEKYIYDIPGFPRILAREYVDKLIEQAMGYKPSVCLNETVVAMERRHVANDEVVELTTRPGGRHFGKSLLITSGIGAFTPRKLDLPEIGRFEGRGISYYVKTKRELEGKNVVVVGGGDSALDWTFGLLEVAKTVTLVHRRERFRAQEETVKKLHTSPVIVKVPYEVTAIHGSGHVERLTIRNAETGMLEEIPADHVVFSLGFHSAPGLLKEWGLTLEKNDIHVNTRMESNIPGIYAAGDISWYPGKLKLIVTGLGEAAIAVNAIKAFVTPGSRFFPGHSSDLKGIDPTQHF